MVTKGWNTTDEYEIGIRKKRAQKEEFIIKPSKKDIYCAYNVQSKNALYIVEIRSFDKDINSCSCPDFAMNKLGTCKHIEAVKIFLQNTKKTKNKHIEIFLDTIKDKITILYPKGSRKNSFVRNKLEPFFSSDNTLLANPIVAFESLMRQIQDFSPIHKKKIKVSSLIEPYLERKKFEAEKITNKNTFLKDYQNSKRSFNFLKLPLLDYQKEGVLHLAFNERAMLADEMGLGKTIQAIGACVLLKNLKNIQKVLVVTPASLKTEWEEQIEKFTNLQTKIIFGNRQKREKKYQENSFFYLCNYEQILYDFELINQILQPDVVILDEAGRIKNWQTKTANSIKRLKSRYAFVLTGTPLENKIDEIYSIVQFLDPYIFGPLFRFNREFYKLDANGMPIGYKNLQLLHKKLSPIMLRRKKADVEDELLPKTTKTYFVQMSKSQEDRYEEYEAIVSRLSAIANKRPLSQEEMKKLQKSLSCMRMLCDSEYILNQKNEKSPKIDEALPVIKELLEEKGRKIIIFSEWERMLFLLDKALKDNNIKTAWHSGSLDQIKRRNEIKRFKEDKECNVLLSTDSGSVGLNLQVADTVINLDMPWNPAKLEQRIARAWRKHQKKTVNVINFVTENKIEHRIVEMLKQKQFLSDNVVDGFGKDELRLPSSKKEFLQDLQRIFPEIKEEKPKKEKSTKSNNTYFAQDVVSILNDKVFQVAQNKSTNTIFVVIDEINEEITKEIKAVANKDIPDTNLTILKKDEYEMIVNLAKNGMIKLDNNLETLYSTQQSHQVDTKKLIKAKEMFQKTKRKYDMALFLYNGGFTKESLPVMKEAIEGFLKILFFLQDIEFKKEDIKKVTQVYNFKDEDKKFIKTIIDDTKEEDEHIIQKSKNIFEKIQKIIMEQ
jgi:predicted nucleic acid-binding Zn finger protein